MHSITCTFNNYTAKYTRSQMVLLIEHDFSKNTEIYSIAQETMPCPAELYTDIETVNRNAVLYPVFSMAYLNLGKT